MLTGETRSGLGIVKPLHPFSLNPEKFGLGAGTTSKTSNLFLARIQSFFRRSQPDVPRKPPIVQARLQRPGSCESERPHLLWT
jgi:hypothetical protein